MTIDITELAQREKFEAWWEREYKHLESSKYTDAVPHIKYGFWMAYQAGGAELVEALEKAQQYAKERDAENQDLMLTVGRLRVEREDLEAIRTAAEKLVRCKGRYHSELNYRAMAALFGVTTPDLPPLEHENVHYADAAEMEIAALRQHIAELSEGKVGNALLERENHHVEVVGKLTEHIDQLESRTVKLPKPHVHLIWIQAGHAPDDYWDDVAVSHSEKDRCCDGSERYPVYARWEIEEMLTAAGIKVDAE
ncbi:ead/Ea22-like family protein [Raoultella ornithinolytica]